MRGFLGLVLTLLGAAVMLYGASIALKELGGLYQGALDNPLGQPADNEKHTSDTMVRGVLVGAAGVPLFLVGTVLIKVAMFRKRGNLAAR
ncbi:MAG: hypothetical protein JSR77_10345 [Planctomycetes bacterium]|nr:hypothetical protein [Planctomycetota bacterium]